MTATEGFNEQEARKTFQNLDVDGDHKLSKSELMVSITHKMMCDRQERLYLAFTQLDANDDGFIDESEMRMALEQSGTDKDFAFLGDPVELIKAADTDGDGRVSLKEFYKSLDPPRTKDDDLLDGLQNETPTAGAAMTVD